MVTGSKGDAKWQGQEVLPYAFINITEKQLLVRDGGRTIDVQLNASEESVQDTE